jgi:hypothetical protein
MVFPPPLADLSPSRLPMANGFCRRGPACQKSVQNATQCGIRATVLMQAGKSPPIAPRLFRNTEQCLRHPPGPDMVSWHRTSRYDAASILPSTPA